MKNNNEQFVGLKVNKWTVLKVQDYKKHREPVFLCQCVCGITKDVLKRNLLTNKSRSCRSCGVKKDSKKQEHRLYSTWNSMRSRCNNPNTENYSWYGGRGISVCERWDSFNNFVEDMYPLFEEGLTLDRVNNDGNYEPDNCRWVNKKEQSKNTRKALCLLFEGCYYTQSELSLKTGIPASTIQRRRNKGWTVEEMIYGKNLQGNPIPFKIKYDDKMFTLKEISELLKIPLPTLQSRKQNGCSDYEIIFGKQNR